MTKQIETTPVKRNAGHWMTGLLPESLLGRFTIVMVVGVLLTQLVGNMFWAAQVRRESQIEVTASSKHLAQSAVSSIRYFLSVPANYRSLIIQQFRSMGGTRFFVNMNTAPVVLNEIAPSPLAEMAKHEISQEIQVAIPQLTDGQRLKLGFAWPNDLAVSNDGSHVNNLPDNWVQHILITKPNPAPILVIQVELEPGHWLYLATLMPNPYFITSSNPFSTDRIVLLLVSLAVVVLLSFMVVRWITRPLETLSKAAEEFGSGQSETLLEIPETGSKEFVNTARAFTMMRQRIQEYIDDRERLFVSISHDLRTPIMRLKLRAELLDDDILRNEFHEDLDELDMMVKGALQCVKDSAIYENSTQIKLDSLIGRMVRDAQLHDRHVMFAESGLTIIGKPLALKRAISNLMENAFHYGKEVRISVTQVTDTIEISICDRGPGVPEEALAYLCEPYVRLAHGRDQNSTGIGMGLSIAKEIVEAHHGKLRLENLSEGGFSATLVLPIATQ